MPQQKEEQSKEKPFVSILKRERALHGWSQADVAGKIGSDPKTVGRWERGLTSPSPYLSQRLSELYEKSVEELGLVVSDKQNFFEDEKGIENSSGDEIAREHTPMPQIAIQEKVAEPALISPSRRWSVVHRLLPGGDNPTRRSLLFRALIIVLLLFVIVDACWLLYGAFVTHAPDPYTGQGTLALNDSLQANSGSGWSLSNNEEGQCFFADGTYRVRGIKSAFMKLCVAAETYFNDFTYEVRMQVVVGDCGGLGFRTTFPQLYYFVICQDGNYRFVRYDTKQSNKRIIVSGVSSAIQHGLKRTNVLAVVARGDSFTLYVNHRRLYQGTDEVYLDGQIGLLVHTCSLTYLTAKPDVCSAPVEAIFSDAKVWKM